MTINNMHQAKSNLSSLVEQALAGEIVIIAKAGTPIIRLVPFSVKPSKRKLGQFKGKISVPDDFDEINPEIEQLFGVA